MFNYRAKKGIWKHLFKVRYICSFNTCCIIISRQNQPMYLIYLIKNFQKITSKYNINTNYPDKTIINPTLKTQREIDNYTKTYDKQFEKRIIERKLSFE